MPGEQLLDRNTTLSRSFRSSLFQSQSSPMEKLEELGLETDSKLKLSQVRVLTSPPPSQPAALLTSASRTPTTARVNGKRKTLMSNLSRKSLKSVFGSSKATFRKGGARNVSPPPATSETNLETETSQDEDVFLGAAGEKCLVPDMAGQLARRVSSSDWRDPRKGRRVGSPGRTGKAEYFMRQDPRPVLAIQLEDRPRTEFVSRQRVADRRSVSSAPHQAGGARPRTSHHLKVPAVRRRERTEKYSRYSESDLTSDDEAMRQKASRRLELPGRGQDASPLSSSWADVSLTPPPPTSNEVSPETNILQQYSIVSFTQSDMDLVQSSAAR